MWRRNPASDEAPFLWRLLLSCLVLVCAESNAQTSNATLTGRVIDPSGAVVPGVHVVLKSAATGVSQTTTTSADGAYTFPLVQPGRYTVNAQAEGFSPVEITDVVLQVGARIGLDIRQPCQQVDQTGR